mmetsp:Transcript_115805/g.212863  ORF Transcript_115805/g.212863 Transcript_115805/m.212863 type:complete len:100 (+) Transcript_115805:367-666(+)
MGGFWVVDLSSSDLPLEVAEKNTIPPAPSMIRTSTGGCSTSGFHSALFASSPALAFLIQACAHTRYSSALLMCLPQHYACTKQGSERGINCYSKLLTRL